METKVIIIFIIVVLVVAGGAYVLGLQQGAEKIKAAYQEMLTEAAAPGVNPMENLPSANPFEDVKVNPFEGIKVNPFK